MMRPSLRASGCCCGGDGALLHAVTAADVDIALPAASRGAALRVHGDWRARGGRANANNAPPTTTASPSGTGEKKPAIARGFLGRTP